MKEFRRHKVIYDTVIVAISVLIAIFVARSGVLSDFVLRTDGWFVLDAFIAGAFFTSVFTVAPATVVLGSLAAMYPPVIVAFVGGLGAMAGDLIILKFLKKHVTDNVSEVIDNSKNERIKRLLKYRFARWSLVLLGALVIASPFPDELGLTLMGISKISPRRFAIISYALNTLGILAVAAVARNVIV